MSREDAERQLMMPPNNPGSYLIRSSETHPDDYVLSIRGRDMIHIRIQQLKDGSFFIKRGVTFTSITNLVTYYQARGKELPVKLSWPCIVANGEV